MAIYCETNVSLVRPLFILRPLCTTLSGDVRTVLVFILISLNGIHIDVVIFHIPLLTCSVFASSLV